MDDVYIVYRSIGEKPIKGQWPEIIYEYVKDDSQFPWHISWTRKRHEAMVFDEKEEADYYAELLGMRVRKVER